MSSLFVCIFPSPVLLYVWLSEKLSSIRQTEKNFSEDWGLHSGQSSKKFYEKTFHTRKILTLISSVFKVFSFSTLVQYQNTIVWDVPRHGAWCCVRKHNCSWRAGGRGRPWVGKIPHQHLRAWFLFLGSVRDPYRCACDSHRSFGKGTDHRWKAIGEAAHNGTVAEEY